MSIWLFIRIRSRAAPGLAAARDSWHNYRAALTAQRDDYQAMMDKVTHLPGPAARIGRLSVLHGLRTTEARLGWVAEAEAEFC